MEKPEIRSYHDTRDTRGQEEREKVYAKQFAQGYTFRTNSPPERITTDVERYKSEGLDVLVVDRAFGQDGREHPNLKAILIRKKE